MPRRNELPPRRQPPATYFRGKPDVVRDIAPEPPRHRWNDMDHQAVRLQNALHFANTTGQCGQMLECETRKHHIKCAVVIRKPGSVIETHRPILPRPCADIDSLNVTMTCCYQTRHEASPGSIVEHALTGSEKLDNGLELGGSNLSSDRLAAFCLGIEIVA